LTGTSTDHAKVGTLSVFTGFVKTKGRNSPSERKISFAGVILAFSFFGFLGLDRHPTKSGVPPKFSGAQNSFSGTSLPKDTNPGWGPVNVRW